MFIQIKILSYSVFKLKFPYCAFTSPYLLPLYIAVKYNFTSTTQKFFVTSNNKSNICNFLTLHITETKQYQFLSDFNLLTSYFMQLKIKLTFSQLSSIQIWWWLERSPH